MKVRKELTKKFYDTAKEWWSKHSFPFIHISFLPVNVFVVSDNDQDLYCMFFYHTDSALAYLAYPISNLEASKKEREGGFEFLLNEMEKYALKEGYYLTYTTSPLKVVQDTLLNLGYIEGDISVNQYFKQLI